MTKAQWEGLDPIISENMFITLQYAAWNDIADCYRITLCDMARERKLRDDALITMLYGA